MRWRLRRVAGGGHACPSPTCCALWRGASFPAGVWRCPVDLETPLRVMSYDVTTTAPPSAATYSVTTADPRREPGSPDAGEFARIWPPGHTWAQNDVRFFCLLHRDRERLRWRPPRNANACPSPPSGAGIAVGDRQAIPGPAGAAPGALGVARGTQQHRPPNVRYIRGQFGAGEAALAAPAGSGGGGSGGSGGDSDATDPGGRAAAASALRDAHSRT